MIVPKVQKPAPRVISAVPIPTDAIARAIGRLIATALPSMTRRITTAASRPITSLRPVVGGSALATTGPPNSTCTPASSPIARVVSIRSLTAAASTSTAFAANWTSA